MPELQGIFEEEGQQVVRVTEGEVFEGTALGRMLGGRGVRKERIERMRREREEGVERRRIMEERTRWVGELKDVLGQRKR